jgi:hypothetical protein
MGHRYDPRLVRDFIDKYPDGTYTEFALKTGSKMVPSNFTYIRRKYRDEKAGLVPKKVNTNPEHNKNEKRSYTRRTPLKIYSQVYFTSVEKLLQDPKAVLVDLVSTLNRTGRTNWEVIELTAPHNIEIREVTKR